MTRTTARRPGAGALAFLAVVLVTLITVITAAPAHASAYRYWTYWQAPVGTTDWTFATQGPGTAIPVDGSVEGWRFAVTTRTGTQEDMPSPDPDFATACADTPAVAGRKRVALVIDTGRPTDAPAGQQAPAASVTCVVADEDATGYDVLRSVTDVRTENGFICGIAGYPVGECAPVLDDAAVAAIAAAASAAPSAKSEPTSSASPSTAMDSGTGSATVDNGTPWAAVGVLVTVIAIGGILLARRRRHG
jgi:hypothetical protein